MPLTSSYSVILEKPLWGKNFLAHKEANGQGLECPNVANVDTAVNLQIINKGHLLDMKENHFKRCIMNKPILFHKKHQ